MPTKRVPHRGGQKRPSLGAPTNGESGVLSTGRGEGLAPQKGESGWAPPIHLPPRPDKPLYLERSGLSKQCFGSTSTNAKSRNPPTTQPQRHLPTTPNCTLPHKTSRVSPTPSMKLKSALNLMQKHDIDVLFLTETKSTQYYTYTSEQHLVTLSGNNKDPHAGVGAIVAPHIRPYIADVVQHNSRIIQIMCKKRGGNIHALGCYAPHSGPSGKSLRAL